ncbi:hypothetical protein BOTBODRAFT_39679 [Botryobasidium botryosum FD-172 SS1]|uniref:Protein BFR2 n=1 Tax=Botryobasidium botryosum (strain FD-172 SS1) TaxID=930990 RepID=A0A067LSR6_BOTB1|nr:hypothetical protein BOTBODRAFT_39679 [Botryobasidium botryosum FD-172 SS1]
MGTRLTLAEQIAQLQDAPPLDFDPEDGAPLDSGDEQDLQAARSHYVDVGPSAIRKLHDSVADPKYEGVKSSRNQIFDDDEEEDDEDEQFDDASDHESHSEDSFHSEPSDDEDDEDDEEEEPAPSKPAPPLMQTSELTSTLKRTRDEDRLKGQAVARQLSLWDTLLDARIRLQKSVTAANRLPAPTKISAYLDHPDCAKAASRLLEEALSLSDNLFDLQEALLTSNEALTLPPRKKRKTSPSPSSSTLDSQRSQLKDATHAFVALEEAYHPHVLTTLHKWSLKINSVAPSALLPAKTRAFSQGRAREGAKSAVELVEEAMGEGEGGRGKVVGRTRVRRAGGCRIGEVFGVNTHDGGTEGAGKKGGVEEGDAEIFDDTDLYQQLLRDVIDSRSGKDGVEDWVTRKQHKVKKAVDTKASKGRKLRYEVHEKLQNFMVPVPVRSGAWHEEQIDELFASLLGKGFGHHENSVAHDTTNLDPNISHPGNNVDIDIDIDGGVGGVAMGSGSIAGGAGHESRVEAEGLAVGALNLAGLRVFG